MFGRKKEKKKEKKDNLSRKNGIELNLRLVHNNNIILLSLLFRFVSTVLKNGTSFLNAFDSPRPIYCILHIATGIFRVLSFSFSFAMGNRPKKPLVLGFLLWAGPIAAGRAGSDPPFLLVLHPAPVSREFRNTFLRGRKRKRSGKICIPRHFVPEVKTGAQKLWHSSFCFHLAKVGKVQEEGGPKCSSGRLTN